MITSLAVPGAVEAAPRASASVARMPLRITGDVAAPVANALASAVDTGLDRAAIEHRSVVAEASCTDAPCIAERIGAADASHGLVVAVTAADRNYELVATLHDAQTGAVRASKSVTCEVCGASEVTEMLADLVATLAGKLSTEPASPARVTITSDPAGASVRVDGRDRGRAPVEIALPPGPHRIELHKPGWLASVRTIDAAAGVDERVRMTLARGRRPLLGAGVGVLVGGVALAGVGGGLLAIDERPYRRRCSGDDIDFAGHCRFRHDTAAAGIALTSVGVALAVAGITMLALSRRRGRRR